MISIFLNKKVLTTSVMGLLFVGLHGIASATTYYISNAGSDTNNGTSTTTPWKTIAKLNASGSVLQPGDSVLFNKGETFYGMIVPAKSGTATAGITYGSYGAGAKPIISGFKPVTGWTSVGNGVYQASANGASAGLNLVTLNSAIQQVGRYPNADQPNGGYLSYESFSKNATTTPTIGTITDSGSTDTTNWAGAEIAIKKNTWVIERNPIISNTNGTFTYNNPSIYNGIVGYGYFIQRDPRTLDQMGEWYYNNTGKTLQMYFGTNTPSNYDVEVSSLETGFMMVSKSYLTIDGLAFQGFNKYGIYGINGGYNSVKNVDVETMGEYGIYMWNIPSALVDGAYVNNILSNGIFIRNASTNGITVRNSTVTNVGLIDGMGKSGDGTYNGISAIGGTGVVVEYNRVENIGYLGIEFQGNNVVINNNYVSGFCSVKDDGGGIYTWTNLLPGAYANRVVRDNIVLYGVGASKGTTKAISTSARGIYMDGYTSHVDIYNNSVAYMTGGAMNLNNPTYIKIYNNNIYRVGDAVNMQKFSDAPFFVRNLTITGNYMFPYSLKYANAATDLPTYVDPLVDTQSLGNINNNKYYLNSRTPFNWVHSTSTGVYLDLPAQSFKYWQNTMGYDVNSTPFPQTIAPYVVNNVVGANTVVNSGFNTNINNVTVWGGSYSGSYDGTAKITGTGSLKLTPNVSTPKNTVYLYAPVGGVTVGKKYILKFSTYGTAARGSITAGIRKTASPYNDLSVRQQDAFGIGREDHEYLIEPTITDAGASYIITINQSSSPTYIDNIEFYEVNATVNNVYNYTRFEYNDTKVNKTIALDGSYIDFDGTVYTNSITLAPFKSAILMKTTATTTTPAVDTLAPTVPGSVLAVASGTSQVRLGWIASTDTIGVIGYKVYRNGVQVGTTSTTSYVDSNLTASTSYTYTVAAYDAAGNTSAQSPGVIAKTAALPDITAPTVPTGLTATVVSANQINVSWTASTDNVGVVGYKVFRNGTQIGTSPTTSFVNSNVSGSTTYTYTVSAYDAAGNTSVQSSSISATTPAAADTVAPTIPTNLTVNIASSNQIALSWTASTDNVGVVGYKIYRNGLLVGTSTNVSFTNNALSPSTSYTYMIAAYDAAGNTSATSNGLVAQTTAAPDTTAPSIPQNLNGNAGVDTVDVSWTPSTDNVGVAGYNIYRDGVKIASVSEFAYSDMGLSPGTYVYQVDAFDAVGNTSAKTSSLSVTVLTPVVADTVPPTVPSNFNGVASGDQVDLSWNASSDAVGVVGYEIYRDGVKVGSSVTTTYPDMGLTPGTTYSYAILAYDEAGNVSSLTTSISVTVPSITQPPVVVLDTIAPTAPTNFVKVSGITSNLKFSWTASTDNVGVVGYKVYRNGTQIGTTSNTYYTDITAKSGNKYLYKVSAYDAANNKADSNTITVSTKRR